MKAFLSCVIDAIIVEIQSCISISRVKKGFESKIEMTGEITRSLVIRILPSLTMKQISIYFNDFTCFKTYRTILKQIQYEFISRIQVNAQQYDDSVPAEELRELNAVLSSLLQPENYKYEMHRKSLENALEKMLEEAEAQEPDEYEQYDEDEKRSIATLAKNGQLPTVGSPDVDESSISEDDNGHKRNLASMARSGMIGGGKRNIQSLARQMNYVSGKRNIGSLMRNNMFPDSGKRNIGSIVRNGKRNIGYMRNGYGKRNIGYMKNAYGKRNVGTLARDYALPKFTGSKYMDGEFSVTSFFNYTR